VALIIYGGSAAQDSLRQTRKLAVAKDSLVGDWTERKKTRVVHVKYEPLAYLKRSSEVGPRAKTRGKVEGGGLCAAENTLVPIPRVGQLGNLEPDI